MDNFITTITQKGQITLPITMRKRLRLKHNDRVKISLVGKKVVVEPAYDLLDFAGSVTPVKGKNVLTARAEFEKAYERF